jgi:hypothetical protein
VILRRLSQVLIAVNAIITAILTWLINGPAYIFPKHHQAILHCAWSLTGVGIIIAWLLIENKEMRFFLILLAAGALLWISWDTRLIQLLPTSILTILIGRQAIWIASYYLLLAGILLVIIRISIRKQKNVLMIVPIAAFLFDVIGNSWMYHAGAFGPMELKTEIRRHLLIIIPVLFIMSEVIGVLLLSLSETFTTASRSKSPTCSICGYDLRGNIRNVCSECGTPFRCGDNKLSMPRQSRN